GADDVDALDRDLTEVAGRRRLRGPKRGECEDEEAHSAEGCPHPEQLQLATELTMSHRRLSKKKATLKGSPYRIPHSDRIPNSKFLLLDSHQLAWSCVLVFDPNDDGISNPLR